LKNRVKDIYKKASYTPKCGNHLLFIVEDPIPAMRPVKDAYNAKH